MITANRRFMAMLIALVAVALFLTIGNSAFAQANSSEPNGQTRTCHMKPGPCQEAAPCCQAPQPRQGIISHVNHFLSFGCHLNYQLDNWILSDKCKTD